jgi:hypothetical protein
MDRRMNYRSRVSWLMRGLNRGAIRLAVGNPTLQAPQAHMQSGSPSCTLCPDGSMQNGGIDLAPNCLFSDVRSSVSSIGRK